MSELIGIGPQCYCGRPMESDMGRDWLWMAEDETPHRLIAVCSSCEDDGVASFLLEIGWTPFRRIRGQGLSA